MVEAVGACSTDIYEAVVALSRSIAGCSDLETLLSGVAESVRRIVGFDYVGMALHDAKGNAMRSRILREQGPPVASLSLTVDEDPAGWVWLHQQPLVIPRLEDEVRWPKFRSRAHAANICSLTL